MKRMEASNEFRRALMEAQKEEFSGVPQEDELDVSFSPEFEKNMERLCRGTQRKTWRLVNTTAKRVLIAAILVVLLAMTVVAAVPALREGLIRFFTHDNGVFYSFEFSEEDLARAPETIETVYLPTYIPEGYHLISGPNVDGLLTSVLYQDENEYYAIRYSQYALWSDGPIANVDSNIPTMLGIDSEGAITETAIINGYEVQAIHYNPEEAANPTIYLWTDHEYLYLIEIQNTTEYGLNEFSKIQASLSGQPYSDYEEAILGGT